MKKLLVPVLVLGLGFSTAALAQLATDFVAVDVDASGDVSLAEAQTVWADLTAEAWAGADTNGDGVVDQAEYEAVLAANPPAM
jgi:hypothetical protein